jgi:hypothetical protein
VPEHAVRLVGFCDLESGLCLFILTQCSQVRLPRVPAARTHIAAQCCAAQAPDEWLLHVRRAEGFSSLRIGIH